MSNIFKANSRFSSLMEEKRDKSEINNRKGNDNVNGERMNSKFKTTENDRKSKFGGDKTKQQAIILNDTNFPTLTANNVKPTNNTNVRPENTNFLEKLTAVTIEKEKEKETDITNLEEYILPGWLFMKRDKDTNKIIKKYGKMTTFEKTDLTDYEIIEKLVVLHDKRREDYINTWGQDEYEKMFRFPNYDYDYFERLDEEEEEELEQLREYDLLKYYSEGEYYDEFN